MTRPTHGENNDFLLGALEPGQHEIDVQVLAAYDASDRHIPDSDLDDEQPITLMVRTTLGEVRRIRRLAYVLRNAAKASAAENDARAKYDETL